MVHQHCRSGRGPAALASAVLLAALGATGRAAAAADYLHLAHDLDVDPATGAVAATVTLTALSGPEPLASVPLLLDQGLAVTGASSPGRTVTVLEAQRAPWRYVSLAIEPPVPAGAQAQITLSYAGALLCQPYQSSETTTETFCHVGDPGGLARLAQGSPFPLWLDGGGLQLNDNVTQEIALRTPSGVPVLVTAELVADVDDGVVRATQWVVPQRTHVGLLEAYLGFAVTTVPGLRGHEVRIHHPRADATWLAELLDWTPPVLDFLEARIGAPLPIDPLHLVRVPPGMGVAFATQLIGALKIPDELFALGPVKAEEALFHEIAHQWWALAVSPTDATLQAVLTEGVTTLTMHEYTGERHHAAEDRDLYLARRNRESELLIRYVTDPATFPPIVVAQAEQAPWEAGSALIDKMLWGYYKPAATLEYLRVTIGEEVFRKALSTFTQKWAFADCTIDDFKAHVEIESRRDLTDFFAQWFTASTYPALRVGFERAGSDDELVVQLAQNGEGRVPVELWLELEDGTRKRRSVMLAGATGEIALATPGPVRAVRPNPRQDAILWSRSAVEGDMSFDGEVDGLDLLDCAWRHGKRVEITGEPGEPFGGLDVDFEPRCDADGDGVLGDADVDAVAARFGTRG
jgi:hypothetical protein